MDEVTEDAVLSFFVSEDGSLRKGCSYKKNISAVFKAGLNWKEPQCQRILSFLPLLRETRKNIQYLTQDEVRLLRVTVESSGLSARNKAVILLLLFTGMRGCDIAGLTFSSIDWEKELILVEQQKTSMPVEILLSAVVGNAIYEGRLKEGTFKFLYSCNNDAIQTKELRLTHNLIASEAGFDKLMQIYDNDPIFKFKREFKKAAERKKYLIDNNATVDEMIRGMDWKYKRRPNIGKQHLDVLLEREDVLALYDHIKLWPYEKFNQIYMDKDSLIDDKVEIEGVVIREAKRDYLIKHLFKIQDIIFLYKNKMFNELLLKTQVRIVTNSNKVRLVNNIEKLISMGNEPIGNVVDFADHAGLCQKR